ncbi:hypothetical protein GCM10009548_69890 [Streptomyces malaysiensis subsp. malaysiensis]
MRSPQGNQHPGRTSEEHTVEEKFERAGSEAPDDPFAKHRAREQRKHSDEGVVNVASFPA